VQHPQDDNIIRFDSIVNGERESVGESTSDFMIDDSIHLGHEIDLLKSLFDAFQEFVAESVPLALVPVPRVREVGLCFQDGLSLQVTSLVSLESGLHIFPGRTGMRIGLHRREPSFEFLLVGLWNFHRLHGIRDAVPDLLDESDSVIDAEPVNAQGAYRWIHRRILSS